jgi:acetolactate synthase-1/2/3 large subunit
MRIKVSDVIAQFLAEKKASHVFGIIGAGNAHIFDSITKLGASEIVCVHHEQAATMAMQAYYKVRGTPTVALLTTGGGAANGLTGVVGSWMDSIPSLIIAGNEASRHTRPDNHLRIYGVQGFNSVEVVRTFTKYSVRVMDPTRILYELQKAYCIATSGRPGPCWVEVPLDIQSKMVAQNGLPAFSKEEIQAIERPASQISSESLAAAVAAIANRLREAKRPVLWLGVGIRMAGAVAEVQKLVDKLKIPCLVTWSAIDLLDSYHPLNYGRAGIYGNRSANFILQNCDYLLAIGTRMAIPQVGYDISELARAAAITVVDIDPLELEKYKDRYESTVCADAGDFITQLDKEFETQFAPPAPWIVRCNKYRSDYPFVGPEHADKNGFINSYRFMEKLRCHMKPDQIVVTDMGTALLCAHQVLQVTPPQRLITSQGLGEMGFGLPAAMGASFARERGEVLCLNCDGGMMMNLQELQTVVHHQLPIKIVVFNNDGYLMIKHTQNAWFGGRRSGTDKVTGISCPNYSELADAFGIPAFQIRTWEDFDDVIPRMQALFGPAICEVFMDPEQIFAPKLAAIQQKDGTLISPPLEDLSPQLSREELASNMLIGMHSKSKAAEGSVG